MKKMSVLLILMGSIVWSLTMIKSGLIYSFGMGFWGPNGHDGIWHIALIEELAKGSTAMPVFAGEVIKNYHIGYDLLLATIRRLTGISSQTLYFQIFPPIVALITGFLTYKFVLYWRNSKTEAFWSTFFVYFGGSLGWVVTLLRGGGIGGESMFWAQQAASTLINPPYAVSVILMLLGLIYVKKYKDSGKVWHFLASIFFLGILAQVKIYASILMIGSLVIASLLFREKKLIGLLLGIGLVSLIVTLPLNSDSYSLIVFYPFWFLETMMVLSDRLDWPRFASAMGNYKLEGNLIKGAASYFVALIIFWIGNMGTRVLKEVIIITSLRNKKFSFLEVMLFSIILLGFALPMFFVQKGTPWNTIQFFYYSLFFSGILAGCSTSVILERFKPKAAVILALILILVTIPSTWATLRNYLPARPPAKISKEELEALGFLKGQPDGVVLTFPFDKYKAKEAEPNPPRPLYLYESTAYVSALTGKKTYLEDEVNLDITNYPWEERKKEVESFYLLNKEVEARKFLSSNNIRYVYWINGQRAVLGESQLGLKEIFQNKEVKIYRVN